MVVIWAYSQVTTNQLGMNQQAYQIFTGALTNAADAASIQVTPASVSDGTPVFDQKQADTQFKQVLASNLNLDPTTLQPKANTLFTTAPVIQLEKFFDYSNTTFPYHYVNSQYGIDVTLNGPSIVYSVEISSPRYYLSTQSFEMQWSEAVAYPDNP